jgi:DNA repair protein SbcD/Mre11
MRFIHTADWHLGRSFYNVSLIEDQAYVLHHLLEVAKDTRPDVVIVAGDIYDRAVPPVDAVKLLDETLCQLILDLKLPIILIGGNHDNPLRLEFAARLMETHRLYVYGSLSDRLQAIDMFDEGGRVTFFPLPYTEPVHTSEYFNMPEVVNHEQALSEWLNFIRSKRLPESRTVLIHHGLVVGGERSESERPLDIGGAEGVPAECFYDFDYVALGHLHRSQSLGTNDHIHYSGSLLKYSFSEVEHTKGIKLVEMDETGRCQVESIPLLPKHDVRRISGNIEDFLQGNIEIGNRNDYVEVRLSDPGAVFDAMNRLREVFPNLVAIDHTSILPSGNEIKRGDHRRREMADLFNEFYNFVTGEALTDEQITAFSAVINRMRESERLK